MKLSYILAITCTFSEGDRVRRCLCCQQDEIPQPTSAPTEPMMPVSEELERACAVCLEDFSQTKLPNRLLKPNGEPACNGLHPICGGCVSKLQIKQGGLRECPVCKENFSTCREYFSLDVPFDEFIKAFPKNKHGGYDPTMFATYLKTRFFHDFGDTELIIFAHSLANDIKCDQKRTWVTKEEIENNWSSLMARVQGMIPFPTAQDSFATQARDLSATQIAAVCPSDYLRVIRSDLSTALTRKCNRGRLF